MNFPNRYRLMTVFTIAGILILGFVWRVQGQSSSICDENALKMLNTINDFRLNRQNAFPLVTNETLCALALQQLKYLEGLQMNQFPNHDLKTRTDNATGITTRVEDWLQNTDYVPYPDGNYAVELQTFASVREDNDFDRVITNISTVSPYSDFFRSEKYREIGLAGVYNAALGRYIYVFILGSQPNRLAAIPVNPGAIHQRMETFDTSIIPVVVQNEGYQPQGGTHFGAVTSVELSLRPPAAASPDGFYGFGECDIPAEVRIRQPYQKSPYMLDMTSVGLGRHTIYVRLCDSSDQMLILTLQVGIGDELVITDNVDQTAISKTLTAIAPQATSTPTPDVIATSVAGTAISIAQAATAQAIQQQTFTAQQARDSVATQAAISTATQFALNFAYNTQTAQAQIDSQLTAIVETATSAYSPTPPIETKVAETATAAYNQTQALVVMQTQAAETEIAMISTIPPLLSFTATPNAPVRQPAPALPAATATPITPTITPFNSPNSAVWFHLIWDTDYMVITNVRGGELRISTINRLSLAALNNRDEQLVIGRFDVPKPETIPDNACVVMKRRRTGTWLLFNELKARFTNTPCVQIVLQLDPAYAPWVNDFEVRFGIDARGRYEVLARCSASAGFCEAVKPTNP